MLTPVERTIKLAKTMNNAEKFTDICSASSTNTNTQGGSTSQYRASLNQMPKSQCNLQIQQWDIQATKVNLWKTNTNNKCTGRISTYSTTKVTITHPQVHKPQIPNIDQSSAWSKIAKFETLTFHRLCVKNSVTKIARILSIWMSKY